VILVRTERSEERIASIIRLVFVRIVLQLLVTATVVRS
jgi:hypothetical protein